MESRPSTRAEKLIGGVVEGRRAAEACARHARPAGIPRLALALLALSLLVLALPALEAQFDSYEPPLIDVEFYRISADIDLLGQSLESLAEVRFVPRESTNNVVFELHNSLNVNGVLNEAGDSIPVDRYRQNNTVRLTFPDTLPIDNAVTLTFHYEGQLTGTENSPVEGVSLAAIEPDRAYLLYPGRWFPVNGYAADRFSAEINITVDEGYQVIASGVGTREEVEGRIKHSYSFSQNSFPGSVAVVAEDAVATDYDGVTAQFYFKTASERLAEEYGEALSLMMGYYSETFGSPYTTNLTVVETGDLAPVGYSAPGIIFLSSFGIGEEVNRSLLGKEVGASMVARARLAGQPQP